VAPGSHQITASYILDPYNGGSTSTITQVVAASTPGTATIVSNPYGTLTVYGATMNGNTISNWSNNVTILLGNIPGGAGSVAEIDFDGLNLAARGSISIDAGAPGQVVRLVDTSGKPSAIAGSIGSSEAGAGFAALVFENSSGLATYPGGGMLSLAGIVVDTLGATWMDGGPLINNGVIDAGLRLEIFASDITGGGTPGNGEFRGDRIVLHTFGNAHNPIHGNDFLQNAIFLQPGTGTSIVDLTINAYGNAPQVFNLRMVRDSGAIVRMPSAWPAGSSFPLNNAVVAPTGARPRGVPDPSYGGGSMILRAARVITLGDEGTGDFVFPGAIVLKSDVAIDFNNVALNQGWTTSGQSFQGVFLEAPQIMSSSGNIRVYGNDLNWINFSTMPTTPVRAFSLVRNADGTASFAQSDATAPHLNTYSVISAAAVAGGCWTCLVNTTPINVYGP